VERQIDLCWHIRGDFATQLPLAEKPFDPPVQPGYSELGDVRRATTDAAWQASFARDGNTARFLAAGGTATEVIVADGHLQNERPKTILQRRRTAATLYGNALDISGKDGGFVRGVVTEGSLEAGFCLLRIETADGTDLCYASYEPGEKKVADMTTDAQQTFVRRDGKAVRALYLGGGTVLAVDGGGLRRATPGLAYVERAATGAFVVGNPSSEESELTLTLPGMAELDAWTINLDGRRGARVTPKAAANGGIVLTLPAAGRIELAKAGTEGIHAQRQAVLLKKQAERDAADAKAKEEAKARSDARARAAAAAPVPANTWVVLHAASFSGQGGGDVKPAPNRVGATGTVFSGWDGLGHWLEWNVTVPAAGYYTLSLLYCSAMEGAERELSVNGAVQEPDAPLSLSATGGWANSSDDWQVYTLPDPVTGKPLLIQLKQGGNAVRLTNTSGRGANVDLLAITSPDVAVDRAALVDRAPADAAP
jgi:hypothetical protein